jgi:hypothetical protein
MEAGIGVLLTGNNPMAGFCVHDNEHLGFIK